MSEHYYTHTGFLPSGNSCTWYFDKNKNTSYASSHAVDLWSKSPKIGDKVKLVYGGYMGYALLEVYINDERVYKYKKEDREIIADDIQSKTDEMKKRKGFY